MDAEQSFSRFKAFYERTKGEAWDKPKKPEKGQINSAGGDKRERSTDKRRNRSV